MNKWSFFAAILLALFLTACGDTSNMGDSSGIEQECEFGISGNGDCLEEGDDGIPDAH